MGYAMFTMRKQFLTAQLNDINFKLMNLSQQKQELADVGSMLGDKGISQKELYNSSVGARRWAEGAIMSAGQVGQVQSGSVSGEYGWNFSDNASQALNYSLYQQEKRIDTEMNRLQTQLKAKEQELESVNQGEEKAIKRDTPKY